MQSEKTQKNSRSETVELDSDVYATSESSISDESWGQLAASKYYFWLENGILHGIPYASSNVSPPQITKPNEPDQSWFWTTRWQQMEAEADEDLATECFKSFETIDEMVRFLDSEDE